MQSAMCPVCGDFLNGAEKCSKCGWNIIGKDELSQLMPFEKDVYIHRLEEAKQRWEEFKGYDQSSVTNATSGNANHEEGIGWELLQ